MGGKTKLNIVLLIVISILLLSLSSIFVSSSTCILSNRCEDITNNDEYLTCIGQQGIYNGARYDARALINIPECDYGCCCSKPDAQRIGYALACPSQFHSSRNNASFNDITLCNNYCNGGITTIQCEYKSCEQSNSNVNCLCNGKLITSANTDDDYCLAIDDATSVFSDFLSCKKRLDELTSGYSVSGKVIIDGSNPPTPLSGVIVETLGMQKISNLDGSFTFTGIQSSGNNMWNITATKIGFSKAYVNYKVMSSNINNLIIYIKNISKPENCNYNLANRNLATWDLDNDNCAAMFDTDCANYQSMKERNQCDNCDTTNSCGDKSCKTSDKCLIQQVSYTCGDGKIGDGSGILGHNVNTYGVPEICDSNGNVGCGFGATCDRCLQCLPNINQNSCGNGLKDIENGEQCDYKISINGGCPNADQICTNNCQCVSGNNCGNGILETPAEMCDISSTGVLASGSICSISQCNRPGEPNQCLCKSKETCNGIDFISGVTECVKDVNESACGGRECDAATCKCLQCSSGQKTPNLVITNLTNGKKLDWTISCVHETPLNYIISRCDNINGVMNNCTESFKQVDSSTKTFEDITSAGYCYQIAAVYSHNDKYLSNIQCVGAPKTSECDNTQSDSFCDNNKVTTCQADRTKKVTTDCNALPITDGKNYNCIDLGVSAKCVRQTNCEECNGLFSMFSSAGKTTKGETGIRYLNNAFCGDILNCYMDYTTTSVDKYYSCKEDNKEVVSCYDYKSEYACNLDKCGVNNKNCEWMNSTKFSEVGIGVCRPKEASKQDCNKCEGNSLNKFFGQCDEDYCMLFANESCYYNKENNFVLTACSNKKELSCDYYANEDECLGVGASKKSSSMNILWNTSVTEVYPYYGDNTHVNLSHDYYSFGYCVWDGEKCFKDGNGDMQKDCDDYDMDCAKDLTAPESNVIFTNPLPKNLKIGFSLIDNESKTNNKFHFNIVKKGEYCYPNATDTDLTFVKNLYDNVTTGEINNYEVPKSGEYTICYFGEDANKNFENVKYETIIVDADAPNINYNKTQIVYDLPSLIVNDETYALTNVTITASVEELENTTCNFKLLSTTYPLFTDGGFTRRINKGTPFIINYPSLKDGDYTFYGTCKDSAGNLNLEENREYNFRIDADQHIYDLMPNITFGPNDEINGKISVILQAKTNDSAYCRFGTTTNFSEMTPFSTTGDKTHTKILTFPDDFPTANLAKTGIKSYYVKCNFTNNIGQSRIYGNNANMVHFAFDYTAPETVIIKNGVEIELNDTNWYKRNDVIGLSLKCKDKPLLYYNIRDYAAGCGKVQYNLTNPRPESNTNVQLTNSLTYQAPLNIPPGNKIFTLYYRSIDSKGNNESGITDKSIMIDDEVPGFTFKIIDSYKDINVTKITFGRPYEVYITSSKKIPNYDSGYYIDVLDAGFNFNGKKYSLSNITLVRTSDSPSELSWVGTLYLDRTIFSSANGQAQFYIVSEDKHKIKSNNVTKGKDFTIVTIAPTLPTIEPSFTNTGNSFEFFYGNLFHEKNGIYYTNDKYLFVTGNSQDLYLINFHLNDIFNPFSVYDQINNSPNKVGISQETSEQSSQGSTILTFEGDITTTYKNGNYLYIQGIGNERYAYKHYKEYYPITNSWVEGPITNQITKVNLSVPLEKTIPKKILVDVHEKRYQRNWFGMPLNLSIGKNNFSIRIVDDVENAKSTDIYTIFYDNISPVYLSKYPNPDSIIGNNNVSIKIKIYDVLSGIETVGNNKIKLKINGVETLPTQLQVTTQNTTEIGQNGEMPKYNYNITYPSPGNLVDGKYLIEFTAYDLAVNKISFNWSFEIDSKAPSSPELNFENIDKTKHYSDALSNWFIKRPTRFTLNFSDNAEVAINNIDLYHMNNNAPLFSKQNITNCVKNQTEKNKFHCNFKDNSLIDGDYALRITSSKVVENVTKLGQEYKYFTIDSIAPTFTLQYDNTTNSNANIIFTALVNNQERLLKAYIKIANDPLSELIPADGAFGSNYAYLFEQPFGFSWNVAELETKDYTFTFTLEDMAGNIAQKDYVLTIDNEPPTMIIKNISSIREYVKNINPSRVQNISKVNETNPNNAENLRFRGNMVNILGEISRGSKGYDIQKIILKKMDSNSVIMPNDQKIFNPCTGNSRTDCVSNINGAVYINYSLTTRPGQETPYYLLFQIQDYAENNAYYKLVLVSDLKNPRPPEITIVQS